MFNAKKTAGIQFGQQKELCEFNGQVINWRTSVKHLGNVVDNSLSDKSDCRSKRAAFIGSANRCIGNCNYHKDCTKRKHTYGKHTVLPFTGLHCGYVNRTALMNVVRRGAKLLDGFLTCHIELITTLLGH